MKISGNSIRSLSKILKITGGKTKIRAAINMDGLPANLIESLGFDKTPKVGDYLMPASVGKFTDFNVNGKEVVRKDLPKVSKSIMYFGTTRDWHGGLHSSTMTRTAKVYQRDYKKAPSETLQIIEINGQQFISSSELDLNDIDDSRNVHTCNVMLECFGEFQIVDVEQMEVIGPTLKRLQWDVLPKGQYPWSKSKPIIKAAISGLDKKEQEVIEYRMSLISRRSPDFLATGRGGFKGYFVYGFLEKSKYVLESIHLDNATYVFESNWEILSQLTKNEIINSDIPHKRIIHNKGWPMALGRAIG